MNITVKIIPIGNSAGVVLPKDLLAHLNVQVGEVLTVSKTPNSIDLRPANSDFDAQLAAARVVMSRRKRALRELAK